MKKVFLFFVIVLLNISVFAQNDTTKKTVPTGWKFGGAVPAISYDSDVGFRYGALGYVYDWDDGSTYPDYVRSIYAEWSRTTKGSGVNRIQYDDRALFGSNIRLFADMAYLLEQSLDFYGFNGYQAIYNPDFVEDSSRIYYRVDRRDLRGILDFQFPIIDNKLRAYTGVNISNMKMGSINVDKLNKGKDPKDFLPKQDTMPGLYENYVNWKVIDPSEKDGGFTTVFKGGLIYDTRDNEAWSTKGMWTEAILYGSPGFGGTKPFLSASVTHRQFFTIIPKKLTTAYRIVYQGVLAGDMPYYLRPYYFNTKEMRDGIGGSKTVRGILRNKVCGKSILLGNFELRYRLLNTVILKQNFYVALSAFVDGTSVLEPYDLNLTDVPSDKVNLYFNQDKSIMRKPHIGYGGGLRIGVNENFILAVEYGLTPDKQDGKSGFYIAMGWLF